MFSKLIVVMILSWINVCLCYEVINFAFENQTPVALANNEERNFESKVSSAFAKMERMSFLEQSIFEQLAR